MKKWEMPEIINLGVEDTKEEECPSLYLFVQPMTPIPNGKDGVKNCPWWNGIGCTHKNYGNGNKKNWPCAKSPIVEIS